MATLRSLQWWAWAATFGVGCSVNHAGLPADSGASTAAGTGGFAITVDGSAAGSGGIVARGEGGDSGSGGVVATGGRVGSGGSGSGGASGSDAGAEGGGKGGYFATGGAVATGGSLATGGVVGAGGGAASGGTGGPAGGSGGAGEGVTGSGGRAPGTGGQMQINTGGAVGTGGAKSGGAPGSGGASASGGASSTGGAGSGGRAGTGGRTATCNGYPNAMAFIPPDDNRTHCYWFRNDLRTWPTARAQCMNETGGDLVAITSQAENEIVRGGARFMGEFPQVWIGATDGRMAPDTSGPGTYQWVTKEPWSAYTNWNQSSPKQPDGYCDPCNSSKDCTCDHVGTMAADGTWYDFWEGNPRGYVCEAVPPLN